MKQGQGIVYACKVTDVYRTKRKLREWVSQNSSWGTVCCEGRRAPLTRHEG